MISRKFWVGLPWELLYMDDLVVVNVEEVRSLALRFYGHFQVILG